MKIEKMKKKKLWSDTLKFALFFSAILLLQEIFFAYQAFHWIAFRSLFRDPITFFVYYAPKISICLFIASFILLTRRKWWIFVVDGIVVVWLFSNLIYYRVNGNLLDSYSLMMVGNMKGFWGGILPFIRFSDLLLVLPLFLLFGWYVFFKNEINEVGPAIWIFLSLCVLSILFSIGGTVFQYNIKKRYMTSAEREEQEGVMIPLCPFSVRGAELLGIHMSCVWYSQYTSGTHLLVYDICNLVRHIIEREETNTLSETEKIKCQGFFNVSGNAECPASNLYIILFESLENWALSPYTTPNIYQFLNSHTNVLWSKKITCQKKRGMSADGQMIVNTGVLPIAEGAVCFNYPDNCFPSLSEQYENAACIKSGDMSVWNQVGMNDAYGIDNSFTVIEGIDSLVGSLLIEKYNDFPFILALTEASHTPFISFSEKCPLEFNKEMPETMRNYLNCVHYTDNCLGEFLRRVDTDERLKSSTIVITGDHIIFDEKTREWFGEYCDRKGESYTVRDGYCPLIIYSPAIKSKTITDEVNYQMDIYPTILHLIGRDSTYYWKGFGKNILDDDSRCISPEDAFILSDKLIRADYFRTMTGKGMNPKGMVTVIKY